MALRMVIVAYILCGTKRLNPFFSFHEGSGVAYFRSFQVSFLLLFMVEMRGKDKISLHCSQSCRYSVE